MTTAEIKAELFDLQYHNCNGRMSFPPDEDDHPCTHCRRIIDLRKMLEELNRPAGERKGVMLQ